MRPTRSRRWSRSSRPARPTAGKADVAKLKNVPHLIVWGDHLAEHPFWGKVRGNIGAGRARSAAPAAPPTRWTCRPKGIRGNSHMLMMDTNSDEIAGKVQAWMAAKGLMR